MWRSSSRLCHSARCLSLGRAARTKADVTCSLIQPLPNTAPCGQEAPPTQRQLVEFNNGIYVGATTANSSLTTINVVVRAGSRYEHQGELGVSHFLRRVAYKSTDKHTAVYMTCLPQWFGMQLSCTGTREAIIYSGTCLKDDVDHLLDVMCQTIAAPKFYNWEIRYHPSDQDEFCPRLIDADQRVTGDLAGLALDKTASLFDAVQNRAFRGTLSRSVFCPSHRIADITEDDVAAYHRRRFVGGNLGVFGCGIHPDDLINAITRHGMYNIPKGDASAVAADTPSKFTASNQEIRQETGDSRVQAVLVGQGAGLSSEASHISSLLLDRVLSNSAMENGMNASRLQTAALKASSGRPTSAQAVNINYSDTGIFGLHVDAGRDDIRSVLKATVGEFTLASANVTEKELTAAKTQLRADLHANQDTQAGILEDMAYQTLYRGGKYLVPEKVAERVEAITLKDVKTFAQSVVNSKHVLGQSGDLHDAPFHDELGL